MKYGWIYVNLLDLWSEPVFNSERLSQLFFGEPVKISRQKNNFFKVAKFDGYTGWADSRFIKLIDKTTLESWHKKKKAGSCIEAGKIDESSRWKTS